MRHWRQQHNYEQYEVAFNTVFKENNESDLSGPFAATALRKRGSRKGTVLKKLFKKRNSFEEIDFGD